MILRFSIIKKITENTVKNIQLLNFVRRTQNDLILNRFNSNLKKEVKNYGSDSIDNEEKNFTSYSKSKAVNYKTYENFTGQKQNTPPSQHYFVTFSSFILIIYFAILREENDLDKKIYEPFADHQSLYKKILIETAKNDTNNLDKLKLKIEELEKKIGKN